MPERPDRSDRFTMSACVSRMHSCALLLYLRVPGPLASGLRSDAVGCGFGFTFSHRSNRCASDGRAHPLSPSGRSGQSLHRRGQVLGVSLQMTGLQVQQHITRSSGTGSGHSRHSLGKKLTISLVLISSGSCKRATHPCLYEAVTHSGLAGIPSALSVYR